MKHTIQFNFDTTVRLAATAAAPWICCDDSHEFCWACDVCGHVFGAWEPQRLFAFEEQVCTCCGHAEGRTLPIGEEEI